MKSETKSRQDDLVKRIGALAEDAQKLARLAVQQYSAEVEAIPANKSFQRKANEEFTLDRIARIEEMQKWLKEIIAG